MPFAELAADAQAGLGDFRENQDRVRLRPQRLGRRNARVKLLQGGTRVAADFGRTGGHRGRVHERERCAERDNLQCLDPHFSLLVALKASEPRHVAQCDAP
jgi:hypothetical protein